MRLPLPPCGDVIFVVAERKIVVERRDALLSCTTPRLSATIFTNLMSLLGYIFMLATDESTTMHRCLSAHSVVALSMKKCVSTAAWVERWNKEASRSEKSKLVMSDSHPDLGAFDGPRFPETTVKPNVTPCGQNYVVNYIYPGQVTIVRLSMSPYVYLLMSSFHQLQMLSVPYYLAIDEF